MPSRDSAAVAVWVKTGGRYEPKKISGISHFLEHMLFKGTKTRTTRQIKEEVEGVGGILNAFTGEEVTCYFAKLLKEHYPQYTIGYSDHSIGILMPAVAVGMGAEIIEKHITLDRNMKGTDHRGSLEPLGGWCRTRS